MDAAGSGVQRGGRTATVLDIGSGGGDIALALAGWAARDGIAVQVTGIDPDERAHAFATAGRPGAGRGRRAPRHRAGPASSSAARTARTWWPRGARFDVVLSNHVLHHLGRERSGRTSSTDSQALAGPGSRSATSGFAHGPLPLFSAGTLPCCPGVPSSGRDGLASIRRSYTGPRSWPTCAAGVGGPVPAPVPELRIHPGTG